VRTINSNTVRKAGQQMPQQGRVCVQDKGRQSMRCLTTICRLFMQIRRQTVGKGTTAHSNPS
jgi:hypothetical protein